MAILVEAATDNKNRTAADVRSMFTKSGGQLAGAGAVAWQFEPRGVVAVARNGSDPDDVALTGDRRRRRRRRHRRRTRSRCVTDPAHLEALRKALEGAGAEVESAEVTMQPKTPIEVDAHVARQNLRLIEALEDLDDVQRVTANFDLPAEILAEAAAV